MLWSTFGVLPVASMAEEPLPLPPVTVPGTPIDPPFIICRDADDSQKPEAGEKEAGDKEGPSQRCSGGGPAIPGPGSGGGGGGGGLISIGNIVITAQTLAQFAADTTNLKFIAAVRDVEYFRLIGGHLPHTPGSLINWAQAQVNWNLYGAANLSLSNQQVVSNPVQSLLGGGG